MLYVQFEQFLIYVSVNEFVILVFGMCVDQLNNFVVWGIGVSKVSD